MADRANLGPEWVNSAAGPFIREVNDWPKELVPLSTGRRGRIFRPNLTLFAYLRLRRGTEIDLADIASAKPHCPEGFDEARLKQWADQATWSRYVAAKSRLSF